MSSSVSEAGKCVDQAGAEIEKANQQKMDQDTARQDARLLLEPLSKRMAGMHAMVRIKSQITMHSTLL